MPTIPDYKKLKKSVQKVESFNRKARDSAVKWCRFGRTTAENIAKRIENDAAAIKSNRAKLDKAYAKWLPVAETLAELQGDLRKAKRRRNKPELREIEQKMKIAEKDYNKYTKEMEKLYGLIIPMEDELKGLGEEIAKI